MKKIKVIGAVLSVISVCILLNGCPEPNEPSSLEGKILILQAYGSSDDASGATHSFVELYNVTDEPVSLNGVYLYYAAGMRQNEAGFNNNKDKSWQRVTLSGTIPPKASFLILGKHESSTVARYVIPDDSGDINDPFFTLSNRSFKVVLIEGDSNRINQYQNPFDIDGKGTKIRGYIDMVGAVNDPNHATNPDRILGFETAPARNSASEAIRRNSLIDTDNNQGISSVFPNGTGDFDSIRYAAGGISNEELAVRRPRNSTETKDGWNPFMPPTEPNSTESLMILQIGAATDGNISKSFVELYNNTSGPIVLDGNYSLQYAAGFSTGGTGGDPGAVSGEKDGPWKKIDLVGTIPPYHSFLILGGADLEDRVTPANTPISVMTNPALSFIENEGDMNIPDFYLSNRVVKVVLINNQTLLSNDLKNPFTGDGAGQVAGYIDMIGVRNGNNDTILGFETALAPSFSKQVGVRRKNLSDTDDNSNDFVTFAFWNFVTRSTGAINNSNDNPVTGYLPEFERNKPKNLTYGAWNPITGVKQ